MKSEILFNQKIDVLAQRMPVPNFARMEKRFFKGLKIGPVFFQTIFNTWFNKPTTKHTDTLGPLQCRGVV